MYCYKKANLCDIMPSPFLYYYLSLHPNWKALKMIKLTTYKKIDYPLSDVVACLVFQILAIILLKLLAGTFGMTEAICVVLAYVAYISVFGYNMMSYFFQDKPTIALAALLSYIALGIRCSTVSFYILDYVNQQALALWLRQWGINVTSADAGMIGLIILLTIGISVQVLGFFLYYRLTFLRQNKKAIYVLCLAATTLLTALCYLPELDDISLIFMLSTLRAMAFAPTIPLLWEMAEDAADNKKLYSYRVTSTVKVGVGLGTLVTGLILLSFGYASSSPDILSWWNTIQAIRWLSSIIPALFFASSIAIILLYPVQYRPARSASLPL